MVTKSQQSAAKEAAIAFVAEKQEAAKARGVISRAATTRRTQAKLAQITGRSTPISRRAATFARDTGVEEDTRQFRDIDVEEEKFALRGGTRPTAEPVTQEAQIIREFQPSRSILRETIIQQELEERRRPPKPLVGSAEAVRRAFERRRLEVSGIRKGQIPTTPLGKARAVGGVAAGLVAGTGELTAGAVERAIPEGTRIFGKTPVKPVEPFKKKIFTGEGLLKPVIPAEQKTRIIRKEELVEGGRFAGEFALETAIVSKAVRPLAKVASTTIKAISTTPPVKILGKATARTITTTSKGLKTVKGLATAKPPKSTLAQLERNIEARKLLSPAEERIAIGERTAARIKIEKTPEFKITQELPPTTAAPFLKAKPKFTVEKLPKGKQTLTEVFRKQPTKETFISEKLGAIKRVKIEKTPEFKITQELPPAEAGRFFPQPSKRVLPKVLQIEKDVLIAKKLKGIKEQKFERFIERDLTKGKIIKFEELEQQFFVRGFRELPPTTAAQFFGATKPATRIVRPPKKTLTEVFAPLPKGEDLLKDIQRVVLARKIEAGGRRSFRLFIKERSRLGQLKEPTRVFITDKEAGELLKSIGKTRPSTPLKFPKPPDVTGGKIIEGRGGTLQIQILKTKPLKTISKVKTVTVPKELKVKPVTTLGVTETQKPSFFLLITPRGKKKPTTDIDFDVFASQEFLTLKGEKQILTQPTIIQPTAQPLVARQRIEEKLIQVALPKQPTILKEKLVSIPKQKQVQVPRQVEFLRPRQRTLLETELKLDTKQVQKPITTEVLRLRGITKTTTKKITRIIPLPSTRLKLIPTKREQAFGVRGRRFGKFKELDVGLTLKGALGIGGKFAEETAGATFEVFKIKGKARKIAVPKFRRERFIAKGGGRFIEKTKFRIDEPGEFREITFAGVKASKKARASRIGFGKLNLSGVI